MKNCSCFLLLFAVLACSEERDPSPEVAGLDFFPLVTGQYVDYQVTTEDYTVDGMSMDSYQLREQVVDSFANEGGTYTFVIYRYRRPDESAGWSFIDTWSARRSQNMAIVNEGNLSLAKLSFPVGNGRTWDGNVLNTLEEDSYQQDSLNDVIDYGEAGSYETVTVVQEDLLDFVINQEDRRYERYARNVGLVEKVARQLHFCDSGDCGDSNIESGWVYNQVIIGHGQE